MKKCGEPVYCCAFVEIFSETGRFSSYGAPSVEKLLDGGTRGSARLLDVSFTALTFGGTEVPRRGVVAAVSPPGSTDVLMLIGSASATRWRKEAGVEKALRGAVESFRVTRTRPTKLARVLDSDYRYAQRSIKALEADEDALDAATDAFDRRLARELTGKAGSLAGVPGVNAYR